MIALPAFTLKSLAAASAVALLVAGCGGGSSAPAGPGTHRTVLAYSKCMQAHGVPNFPDPSPGGGIDKNQITALGNGPQMDRASTVCQHLMPSSGLGPAGPPPRNRFADLLAFATCMRTHGFPTFPDPTRSGRLSVEMITATGIDLHQPAALRAGDACVAASHGAVTRATVARAGSGH